MDDDRTRAVRDIDRCRQQKISHLAVHPHRPPPRPRRPHLPVVRTEHFDVALDVAARERHLHDQVMQHDVVQHDHAGIRHRRAIGELVVRVVAELVD